MRRYETRRDKLLRQVRRAGAEAILVTNFTNVAYLTGFTGDDSSLLLTEKNAIILSDPRYGRQLSEECPDVDVEIRGPGVSMFPWAGEVVRRVGVRSLAVESESMTLGFFERLREAAPNLEFCKTAGLAERSREVKDREEIACLRRAVYCAERAFGVVRASLRPEQTEKEIADSLEREVRRFGGTRCSFSPIVAAGARAALPHATPTTEPVGEGRLLLIDWGAEAGRYMSDLTRLLVVGKISPKLERIYGVVLKAQRRAIEMIRPGATMHEVDAAARSTIVKAGFGKYFGHGLGHGLGLEVHEAPRLAVNQRRPLKPGMVVTVEPGVYLPSWGGVRIEDDVLVTRAGCEVLSRVSRDLADCVVA